MSSFAVIKLVRPVFRDPGEGSRQIGKRNDVPLLVKFAVPLEDVVLESVSSLQARLQLANADVKWTPASNLHLTVAFLGDQAEARFPVIGAFAEQVATETAAFRIAVV